MKKIISNQKLPLLVAFLPFLINLVYYHQLPDKVAVHFDQNFKADNFLSKNIFIFFPIIMVAFQLLLFYIEEKKGAENQALLPVIPWIIPFISIWGTAASIDYSVYGKIRVISLAPLLLGILFVAIGNFLPKTAKNKTVGIKIPTTLASEVNWYHTHRFAGSLWVIIGLMIIFLALSPLSNTWMIPLVLIAIISPMIYSYSLAKKGV